MTQRYYSADEAVALLGISKNTLYSYVSRGLVRSEEIGGKTRARRYLAADIQALEQRKEQRRDPTQSAAAALHFGDPVMESSITLISEGNLYYRGRNALALAEQQRFETVAALLWRGELLATDDLAALWALPSSDASALSSSAATKMTIQEFMAAGRVADAMQMALITAASSDLAAYSQSADAVFQTGTRILRRMTDVLLVDVGTEDKCGELQASAVAAVASAVDPDRSIAQQLAKVWLARERQGADFHEEESAIALLNAMLILCADHELNASSFTARCVASTGATPYLAVIAALSALQGYKHGGATREVALFLREAVGDPERAIQERLQTGRQIPGFGHLLYPAGDPRGNLLLTLAERHCTAVGSALYETATDVCQVVRSVLHLEPNLDFGLTVLANSIGLPSHAPFALFALGRTAGWIGHIIEQYTQDHLIRPRARYTGIQPNSIEVE